MKITSFKIENLASGCVTDNTQPCFTYTVASDVNGTEVKVATLSLNGWQADVKDAPLAYYTGEALAPFTAYVATLHVEDNFGNVADEQVAFRTGRMQTPWQAQWITDTTYSFTEKKVSPTPMAFRKKLALTKRVAQAYLYVTALGIYEFDINGQKVGNDYFAPGFTSYQTTLQYQTYEVSSYLKEENEFIVNVAGGWAVGSFVFSRVNRVTADRQALLCELHVTYEDGTTQIFGTDTSWQVSREGQYKMVDLYDGETFDATVDMDAVAWHNAGVEAVKIKPQIVATLGSLATRHEVMTPVSVQKVGDELIYDFGQNFAGVVCAKLQGKKGQVVTFRHAEVLKKDGTLMTSLLRSAKATATYTCREGEQTYSPKMTYMGFRYVSVTGIAQEDIELCAYAIYSQIEKTGDFACSNELINRLQQNILWSSRSNFVEIPTDCPQRDERMGWTGDIAVFAPTACFNFDMRRFLNKWLRDVRNEQTWGGGIPNTVPVQGYGFPVTMPKKAIAFWGDACVFVPWAMYQAYGDINVLKDNYAMMKKYVKACKFWANIGIGKRRYIWNDIPMMQFGDWIAPDVHTMGEWQGRCKWTGTGSFAATTGLLAQIATILGNQKDARYYTKLNAKINDAYVSVLTDGNGKLKNEFQTAYVLPLYFNMFPADQQQKAAQNLAELVKRNDYCIGTGFPGTPYILFALADNGQEETAFKMLTNTKCPSWLYEVKAGGTTIWEHWDALREDGSVNGGEDDGTGGMSSFNHYASGAVGNFLYSRVLGVEPTSAGYKTFRVKPLIGGGITSAQGHVSGAYGEIAVSWQVKEGKFSAEVEVPVGCTCEFILPDGQTKTFGSGKYTI